MRPIEFTVPWLPEGVGAITLWPFILYKNRAMKELYHEHEMYHWNQALKFGVIPWYIAYVVLLPFYGGGRSHPLEREAYRISDE